MSPTRVRASEVANDYAHSYLQAPASGHTETVAGLMALVIIGMQIGALAARSGPGLVDVLFEDVDDESNDTARDAAAYILNGCES